MNDTVLKVVLPIITAAILGMFGWIWSTSTSVTILESQIGYLQKEQEEVKRSTSDLVQKVDKNKEMLIELQRDMKYIKITLQSIEGSMEKEKQ